MSDIIKAEFKDLIDKFAIFLTVLKEEFSVYDNTHLDRKSRIAFVLKKKQQFFPLFDRFFYQIWETVNSLDKKTYQLYQHYYQTKLGDPLLKAEINKYIKEKPLGYPGDYVMMNYIYDYHDNFLGNSSLEMLINCYTTNIPISHSNVKRKEYFKQKIIDLSAKYDHPRIASVGCGPARELLELVEGGKINKPLNYSCVDFEKKALQFIKDKLAEIENNKKRFLSIKYFQVDIRDLIKDDELSKKIDKQNFIYASGILDYLGKHLAKKIVAVLFNILRDSGLLIIVNAGLKDSEFRSYYELLGEWRFFHRSPEEMIEWIKPLKSVAHYEFEQFPFSMNYQLLKISKMGK